MSKVLRSTFDLKFMERITPRLRHTTFHLLVSILLVFASAGVVVMAAPPVNTGWSSNECISKTGKCAPGTYGGYPAGVNPANFHPGYYILLGQNATQIDFDFIKGNPDFLGVKKIYLWKDIETAENRFDLTKIEKDLTYLKSIGKRLWIEIGYAEWDGRSTPRTPAYMWSDSKYGGSPPYYSVYQNPANSPWYAILWNANLQTRFSALYAALGARYNSDPYVEGVVLEETSVPIGPGYSSAQLENAFKVIALAAKRAFPDKVVIQQINYADFNLSSFSDWLAANSIGIGSPDMLLNPARGQINEVYPLYIRHHTATVTGPDVQWDNYEQYNPATGKTNTSAELLEGAVRYTNPWYMFWDTREPYFTRDAVPAVRNYGPLPAARDFYKSQ